MPSGLSIDISQVFYGQDILEKAKILELDIDYKCLTLNGQDTAHKPLVFHVDWIDSFELCVREMGPLTSSVFKSIAVLRFKYEHVVFGRLIPPGDPIMLEFGHLFKEYEKLVQFIRGYQACLPVTVLSHERIPDCVKNILPPRKLLPFGVEPIVDSGKFAAPNRMSNVILKIGEKKLHVSKEYLAVKSTVFEALFFGEFAEKGKDEVELNDVDYEEFLDFLHVIYFEDVKIADCTVLHILKLADRFLVERVLKLSIMHLTQSKGFDNLKKLLVADQYNLTSLKDQCIQLLTSEPDLMGKLKASPEYDHFSIDLKATIFDRLVKRVLKLSIEHLTQSKGFDNLKKLLVADQCNLTSLKDQCIQLLTSEPDLMGKLKASPEYDHFSVDLKATIFDRLVKK